ncbi:MAG TPA: gamma-glutamyltransferase [Tissierellaceae bacterium]|nr:gamma-glutamyltransferase [Tissierellaceae bacterium]
MNNDRLRNVLIGLSVVLILGFVVVKNSDKIFSKKSADKGKTEPRININNNIGDGNSQYGVTSVNTLVSEVGMKTLEDGGNAVDAAVAMSFALNVIDPQNSGIGGGGGMLIKDGITDQKVFYDYYISSGDVETDVDIGIPGFLKGMELINEEMGNKKLSDLIQYAIDIGEEGVEVTKGYEETLNEYDRIFSIHPSFTKDGRGLVEGDLLYQPELIETLKEVRDNGVDIFYNGEHEISKNFLELTGISKESLNNYEVHKYDPLEIDYRGYKVMAPPAPFSGLTLLQSLLIEEEVDIPKQDFGDIDYNNDMQDILVLTGKEGRETIADPEFTDINYDEELDIDYLMDKFEEGTEDEEDYEDPESVTTTAFSVIDKDGTIVSATNTISNYWGSYIVSDGIIYNNAMKNFTTGKNKFEYNKRPKTGITPVIITNDNSHKETLGTSGGAKIPAYLFKTIVNTKKDDMDVQLANDMERMYYFKRQMYFEGNAPESINENGVVNFEDDYTEYDSSDAWGQMTGLEIKDNGEIKGHTDKRSYFNGGAVYYNGSEIIYNE